MSSVIQNSPQAKYHANHSHIHTEHKTSEMNPRTDLRTFTFCADASAVHMALRPQRILDDWGHSGTAIAHLLNLLNTRESTQNIKILRSING